jgi:hypothetical protein
MGEKVSSEPIGRYKATEALFIYVAVDSEANLASFLRPETGKKASSGAFFHLRPAVQAENNIHVSPLPGLPLRNAICASPFSLRVQTC